MNRPIFGLTSISSPVEHESLLTDQRRAARRRGGEQDVDVAKHFERARAEPAAKFLRLDHPGSRQHRAGDQPVAHVGIEIAGPLAQTIGMQRRALDHGDRIGGGARARGFGQFDRRASRPAPRRCARPPPRPRRRRRARNSRRAARSRRPVAPPSRPRQGRLDGAHGLRGIVGRPAPASRRSSPRGRRPSARTARDDRGWRRTETCPRARAGRRSASGRKFRRARRARGSSRWCRSPARSAPARPRPPPRSRPTIRRSYVRDRADCARGRHARSRR